MQDRPKGLVKIQEWPGLATNVDPHDLQAGAAQVQTNAMSQAPGRLTVRRGYQRTSFTNAGTATLSTAVILAATDYQHPLGNWLVYEDGNGAVRAGMNPG